MAESGKTEIKKVELKKSLEELKWIEDPENTTPTRPPMDFPMVGSGNFESRLVKKTKENIFVPLGLLATTICLTMGLINMKRGDTQRQQLFMRGRVLFQGFTLVAMTAGVFATAVRQKFK